MPRNNKKSKRRGRRPIEEITPPQRRTLVAISNMTGLRGLPPTIAELADRLGISAPSVYAQVRQLIRKGFVRNTPNKARSLEVVSMPREVIPDVVQIPIVGRVAAGTPITAIENIDGEVLVDSHLVKHGRCFALRVQGDSMTGAGIHDGDLVIVRQQQAAENGQIVVALLGEEATVKRLHIAGGVVELLPENPKHKPIPIEPDTEFRIVGQVVGIRRTSAANG